MPGCLSAHEFMSTSSRGHGLTREEERVESDRRAYCGPYFRPVLEDTAPSIPRGTSFAAPISAL